MCKAYRAILLFLTLGGLTTSLPGFADQKIAQTTVGITFVKNEDVPAPNQVITSTRGDPQSARMLPETNSAHNPLLVNSGIGLVLMSGIILIIKKKKKKGKNNE